MQKEGGGATLKKKLFVTVADPDSFALDPYLLFKISGPYPDLA